MSTRKCTKLYARFQCVARSRNNMSSLEVLLSTMLMQSPPVYARQELRTQLQLRCFVAIERLTIDVDFVCWSCSSRHHSCKLAFRRISAHVGIPEHTECTHIFVRVAAASCQLAQTDIEVTSDCPMVTPCLISH
jgi:hypothetical protein